MTIDEARVRNAYLNLLSDVLLNVIYTDPQISQGKVKLLSRLFGRQRKVLGYDQTRREKGLDWPSSAHSMIGKMRMANLRMACTDVIENKIPGDFIETGVWRGGACILMRGILHAYGDTNRKVWVADSFEGLPAPEAAKYAADKGDKHHTVEVLAISLEQVKRHFRAYGLLDEQVLFLKGWFKDTLPAAPIEQLAVLRLDGDMYESTMDGFVNLYHKVSAGGYVIVDDYHAVAGCKKATHDFLNSIGPAGKVDIQEIDGTGVFWKKP
jgi:Macrocin-O-methyltransferase (TylF)